MKVNIRRQPPLHPVDRVNSSACQSCPDPPTVFDSISVRGTTRQYEERVRTRRNQEVEGEPRVWFETMLKRICDRVCWSIEKFLNSYKELNFMFKMLIVSLMEEEESVLVWVEERLWDVTFFGIRVKFVKFIQFLWNFLLLSSVIEEFWLRGILNRTTRTQG